MKLGTFGKGLALVATASLVLAACSTKSSTTNPTTAATSSASTSTAIISTNGSEPANPLIPSATNETGGGKIVDSIFSGLVYYDAKGAPQNEVADSIKTTDSQTFTVKLKAGWKFTDGTPVQAHNFVDAWNWAADLANAKISLNSYFFAPIDGFSWDKSVPKMSGLTVVDDMTFTIKLAQPQADFPLSLGYSAFYPLPDSFLKDPAAFGKAPVGDGPYMLKSAADWQHDVQIDLATNPDYKGGRVAQNGGLKIVFYATEDAAYADLLQGNVDVIDGVPSSAFATFKTDLGDRAVNQPAAIFQSFTIPDRLAHFSGAEGKLRRQALSMAIDRKQITDVVFQGTRTPANDFTSPVISGWSNKIPGAEVLTFDAAKAKALWAQADAISPWSGTFKIGYNADGGHQPWVDAVINSIKNTLGIQAEGNPYPTFALFRTDITAGTIQTAFRTGWQADYPSLFNFLGPLYGTGAGSNDGKYSSAEFDALLKQGSAEPDPVKANVIFQKAQEVLFKDLPAIPLWYANVTGGYSKNVSNVVFGWNSVPLYYQITKK